MINPYLCEILEEFQNHYLRVCKDEDGWNAELMVEDRCIESSNGRKTMDNALEALSNLLEAECYDPIMNVG